MESKWNLSEICVESVWVVVNSMWLLSEWKWLTQISHRFHSPRSVTRCDVHFCSHRIHFSLKVSFCPTKFTFWSFFLMMADGRSNTWGYSGVVSRKTNKWLPNEEFIPTLLLKHMNIYSSWRMGRYSFLEAAIILPFPADRRRRPTMHQPCPMLERMSF